MENNSGVFSIYKNIDSTSAKVVNCALGFVAGAFWVYAFRTDLDPEILDVVQNTFASGLWYCVLSNNSRRVNNTKDVLAIQKKYKSVVKNTALLSKELQFDDPVQIYGLYCYLLENGYLSYTEEFVNTPKNASNITALSGASVMTGRANSEGISNFLSDVFTELGYNNSVMMIHSFEEDEEIIPDLSEKDKDTFVEDLCVKYSLKSMSEEILAKYDRKQREKRFDDRKASLPNHVINVVSDDRGSVYYLDASLKKMYTLKSNDRLYINDYRNRYSIMKNYFDAFHRHPNYKKSTVDELTSRRQEPYNDNRRVFLGAQMVARSKYQLIDEFFESNKKKYEAVYDEIPSQFSL